MNNNPRITIVLPVYNGERYLSESIESILNQEFKDFELIIVDDHSGDGTGEIIENYLAKDSRIRCCYNKKNEGLPYSINKGFYISNGEYLTWTSDDNIYHSDAIEKMVAYLDANPQCGLVYANMNLIDDSGNVIGVRTGGDCNIYKNNCVGACFMYRRICKEYIGDYDENRFLVEDYDYWLRIASKYDIKNIPEILYDYRFHNNSLTVKRMRKVGERLTDLRKNYIQTISDNVDDETYREIIFEMLVCRGEDILPCIKKCNINVDLVINRRREISCRNIWLFGAGALGRAALHMLSDFNVYGFIDNDIKKVGCEIQGKTIISLAEFLKQKGDSTVVICTELRYAYNIMRQLKESGISDAILLYDLVA